MTCPQCFMVVPRLETHTCFRRNTLDESKAPVVYVQPIEAWLDVPVQKKQYTQLLPKDGYSVRYCAVCQREQVHMAFVWERDENKNPVHHCKGHTDYPRRIVEVKPLPANTIVRMGSM